MELENRPPELSMNIVAGLALGAFPIRSLFQWVTDRYCAIDQEQFPILRSGAIIMSAKRWGWGLMNKCRRISSCAGAVLVLLLLGGCDTLIADRSVPAVFGVDFPMTKDSDIVAVSYAATDRLMNEAAVSIDRNKPILVASVANVDNLDESSSFGLIVSEQIGSRLSQLGYTVIESKLRGTLAINGNGEFMLSRDARKIAAAHDAQAVLVGSYAAGPHSAMVSLKIIRLADAKVVAAFDYSMPMGPNTAWLITPVALR